MSKIEADLKQGRIFVGDLIQHVIRGFDGGAIEGRLWDGRRGRKQSGLRSALSGVGIAQRGVGVDGKLRAAVALGLHDGRSVTWVRHPGVDSRGRGIGARQRAMRRNLHHLDAGNSGQSEGDVVGWQGVGAWTGQE